ncbi:unnamed protein product [Rhodiola kirilowii]
MLLDASAGGSMMNLSLSGIRDLITNVAENARFRKETTRQDEFFRTKNVSQAETSVNSMPEEMRQMKEMMMQFLRMQTVQVRPCEFCGSTNHKTDACPTFDRSQPDGGQCSWRIPREQQQSRTPTSSDALPTSPQVVQPERPTNEPVSTKGTKPVPDGPISTEGSKSISAILECCAAIEGYCATILEYCAAIVGLCAAVEYYSVSKPGEK